MLREIIVTDRAPKPIGPYSHAVKFSGTLVYTSGQIAVDPQTGEIVGTTAAEQTEQVIRNLATVLAEAGSSLHKVVKTTIFLKNMSDFAAVNETYGLYFGAEPPARSAVEVARLPKNVLVEIECLALTDLNRPRPTKTPEPRQHPGVLSFIKGFCILYTVYRVLYMNS